MPSAARADEPGCQLTVMHPGLPGAVEDIDLAGPGVAQVHHDRLAVMLGRSVRGRLRPAGLGMSRPGGGERGPAARRYGGGRQAGPAALRSTARRDGPVVPGAGSGRRPASSCVVMTFPFAGGTRPSAGAGHGAAARE